MRNFPLHRGLNIVWSPAGETAADDRLPTGHAAGKTLFCRALRHCLGEASFAAPEDAQRIRAEFPRGGVGAEVEVDGVVWAIRRPFAAGADLAVPAGNVLALADDVVSSFDEYISALQGTLGDPGRLGHYPEPAGHRPWQYALAWLTRDQECRVEGIGSWRHKDTGSRSPVRSSSAEARLTVLRLALDAYDTRAKERASKIENQNRAVAVADSLARRLGAERDALVSALAGALDRREDEVRPPDQGDGLWMDDYRKRTRAFASERIALLEKASPRVVDHLDDARLEVLEPALAESEERLSSELSAVEALRTERALHAEKRPELERELSERKHPTCPYDGEPLDVEASKAACPLVKFPDPDAVRQELAKLKGRKNEVEEQLAELEPRLAARRRSVQTLRGERDTVARRVHRRRAAEDQDRARHDQEIAAAWGARSLVERLLACTERAVEAGRDHGRLVEALQALRDEENAARAEQDVAHIGRWFQGLVHRVLGNGVSGTIRLDGHGLHAEVGQRSVALNSLKVVLFDLAAMLCAAEDRAFVPAFLLHDSPREGDLDPSTYRRIFRAVQTLATSSGDAPFQYIITTTSAPPEECLGSLVRPTLASMPAKDRFYGVDL